MCEEKLKLIKQIKDRYEQDKCINCGGILSIIQYDGYGNEQPYCHLCDIYRPNDDEATLQNIFLILNKR